MNDARERMLDSPIYSDAIKRLIGKLLVPENLTSTERKECLAEMTTKFFDEHQKFVNQTGILHNDTIWYAAGKSDFVVACHWHHTWMLPRTKVLENLASRRPRWLNFERDSSKMTSKIAPSEKFLPNLTELCHRIALSLFQNSYYEFPYTWIFLYWFLYVVWLWVFIASSAYLLGPQILIILNIKLTKNELN